jgi:hypothetical protein
MLARSVRSRIVINAQRIGIVTYGLRAAGYAFFTNSDLSFIPPKPSILQSML